MEPATHMEAILPTAMVGVVSTVTPLATLLAWLKGWRERRGAAPPSPPPAYDHRAEGERPRLEREIGTSQARWRLLC